MLTYTMSEDGRKAHIGPCIAAPVRLSIIHICCSQRWELPPGTLDEDANTVTLRQINLDLLFRRDELRRQYRPAVRERKNIERAKTEIDLPPELSARVAELRSKAASVREGAQYADHNEDMNRDLQEASHLEAEASELIKAHLERGNGAARS